MFIKFCIDKVSHFPENYNNILTILFMLIALIFYYIIAFLFSYFSQIILNTIFLAINEKQISVYHMLSFVPSIIICIFAYFYFFPFEISSYNTSIKDNLINKSKQVYFILMMLFFQLISTIPLKVFDQNLLFMLIPFLVSILVLTINHKLILYVDQQNRNNIASTLL